MRHDLRSPCVDCPFRQEGGRRTTTKHMARVLAYRGPFPCHKTVDYVSRFTWRDRGKAQACAGRLAFLAHVQPQAPALTLAQRLGWACPVGHLLSAIFGSAADLMRAQRPV